MRRTAAVQQQGCKTPSVFFASGTTAKGGQRRFNPGSSLGNPTRPRFTSKKTKTFIVASYSTLQVPTATVCNSKARPGHSSNTFWSKGGGSPTNTLADTFRESSLSSIQCGIRGSIGRSDGGREREQSCGGERDDNCIVKLSRHFKS